LVICLERYLIAVEFKSKAWYDDECG